MVKDERFIAIGKDEKKVILSESDIVFIRDNPHGLTENGAKVEFNEWLTRSRNKYMQARYAAMLKRCKTYTKPGKLKDGRVVLSRAPKIDKVTKEFISADGEPNWSEWVNTDYIRMPRRKWNELPEEKRL